MTKLLWVIIFFITIPLLSFTAYSYAIRSSHSSARDTGLEIKPPVTFARLMNTTHPPTSPYVTPVPKEEDAAKVKRMITLLNKINLDSYRQILPFLPTPTPMPVAQGTTYEALLSDSSLMYSSIPGQDMPISEQVYGATHQYQLQNTGNLQESPIIKTTYKIAILGDSMVDTLGRELSDLRTLLQNAYPGYTFALLNYGQGSQDIEQGLKRLTQETVYNNTYYPALLTQKPDIIVVESFGYNHWSREKSDLDRHWLTIAYIIDAIKRESAATKIVLAATIAPNLQSFGSGTIQWSQDIASDNARTVNAYIENMIHFAHSQGYPIANAYQDSLGVDGGGRKNYISTDNIHPSEEGKHLFSQKIVDTIREYELIPK